MFKLKISFEKYFQERKFIWLVHAFIIHLKFCLFKVKNIYNLFKSIQIKYINSKKEKHQNFKNWIIIWQKKKDRKKNDQKKLYQNKENYQYFIVNPNFSLVCCFLWPYYTVPWWTLTSKKYWEPPSPWIFAKYLNPVVIFSNIKLWLNFLCIFWLSFKLKCF